MNPTVPNAAPAPQQPQTLAGRDVVWKGGKLIDKATGDVVDMSTAAGAAAVGRWSRAAVDDRRRKVWEMHVMKGMPETAVAKWFGVHRNTIVNDVRAIRELNRSKALHTDAMAEIGGMTAQLEDIAKKAMLEYGTADASSAKAQFLSTALKALEQKSRLQFEAGTIPKAATKIEGSLQVQGLDLQKMTLEELYKLRENLVTRGAQLPLEELLKTRRN